MPEDPTLGPGSNSQLEQAVERVYKDLQKIAGQQMHGERAHHTLQRTALVHEAYAKLARNPKLRWENQSHFLALAAGVMRQILVDHSRAKNAGKRGAGQDHVTLHEDQNPAAETNVPLLELDDALNKLRAENEPMAQLIELRAFAGLSLHEAMEVLGQSRRTIDKNWKFAKLWLARELSSA